MSSFEHFHAKESVTCKTYMFSLLLKIISRDMKVVSIPSFLHVSRVTTQIASVFVMILCFPFCEQLKVRDFHCRQLPALGLLKTDRIILCIYKYIVFIGM